MFTKSFNRNLIFVRFCSTKEVAATSAAEDVTAVRARSVALRSDRAGSLADVPRATRESDRYVLPGFCPTVYLPRGNYWNKFDQMSSDRGR